MVRRHKRGKFAAFLPLVVLLLSGAAFHVLPAAAQDADGADARRAEEADPFTTYRLRGSRTEEIAVAEDPFNDGPITEDEGEGTDGETGDTPEPEPVNLGDAGQGRELPVQREPQVLDPINTATPDPRANLREQPVEPGTQRRAQEDPFLPPGFRAGTWQIFTRLEQAIGYSNNNTFAAGGKPGYFTQTDGNVTLRSDWARHEAAIEATGSLRRAFDSGEEAIPSAGINGNLRLDLVDGYTARLGAKYNYSTESLSSTSLVSGVDQRPGVHAYGASAEIARGGGRLDLTLRGTADRTAYEAAMLTGGGTFNQDDRDNTLYWLTGRAAYGPTPSLKPFVQGGIGWRQFDADVDRNGEDRSSLLYDLRAGVQLDLHEKLTGEMAVGYAAERFNADTIRTLDGLTVNGTLDWSPERDTTVRLTATTDFGGSTTAGENGSINYNVLAEAVRRVRDNLAVNALAGYGLTRYDTTGTSDQSYKIGAGIEYWISRYLSLTADVEYERLDSATPESSWNATSVRLGVAVQR